MRLLLQIALKNSRHFFLLGITVVAMCFLTIASQLEIVAMGVLAQKGPDIFELFAPVEEGELQDTLSISKDDVERRWKEIDEGNKGYITKEDASRYLSTVNRKGLVDRAIKILDGFFPVSGNVKNLAIMIAVVALFKAICLFSQRFATKVFAIKISRDLRQQYFEHIQSLPMKFYQQHNSGSLSSRVYTDAYIIADGMNAALVNYMQTPFTIISTLILCFMTSWQLSLMIFLGLPLIVYPIVFLAKNVRRISKQLQKNQEGFASVLIDFLSGIQTVKVFAMEEFSLKKYRDHNYRMAMLERKSARYDVSARPIVHTIGMMFLAAALIYGLYYLNMNVSSVLVYCGMLYIFYEPVKKFAEENSLVQKGAAAAERMFEVLSIQPQIQDQEEPNILTAFEDKIEFRDVWFRYQDEWVLKGLSFTIKKGETVAFVGPTGAGKSTIVQLLPRLYDIEKGEIFIDGKPLQTYTQKSLRENIAFVPQKPFLFLDTIAENISFGRPFTKEQIQAAARQAHAEEFIVQLPNQYDTELSEAGKNLSGGQQQRLAIARALLKNAPILVMDEATSSLDAISENYIKSAITQMQGKVTQIIIAHRLTTIEDADKIIYLEKGQKVAEGTKEELLATCAGFRLMWEMMHRSTNDQN